MCSLRPSFFVFHYICNFSVRWQLQISWTVSVVFLWHWFNKANVDEKPLARHLSFPSPTKHIFFWYLWPVFWSMGFWFQWGSVKSFKFLKLQILFTTFPLCANCVCALKNKRLTCVFHVILFFRFLMTLHICFIISLRLDIDLELNISSSIPYWKSLLCLLFGWFCGTSLAQCKLSDYLSLG